MLHRDPNICLLSIYRYKVTAKQASNRSSTGFFPQRVPSGFPSLGIAPLVLRAEPCTRGLAVIHGGVHAPTAVLLVATSGSCLANHLWRARSTMKNKYDGDITAPQALNGLATSRKEKTAVGMG